MRTPRKVWAEYQNQQEKNMAVQEFLDKAYKHVPAKEIVSLLRENKSAWFNMFVGKGSQYLPIGEYSNEILEATGGDTRDVLFCLIVLNKSEVILFEKLREKVDFFEFSSGFEDKFFLVLQFVKK